MASKVKQSIAAQRQIPEHIRTNYPVFVEFVKMYYEYLQETQQQDLESMHDVDTVLDEFIDRFKFELSRNFPIELVSDKRLILKHLREFYLSRGSEASYQFLFRTLFNKEASLFYPSERMLRVSDGRWTQDVSIFVVPEDVANFNTEELIQRYILITNNRGKVIRTVVENIVKYNDSTFEIFISRDYINEINVGASIKTEAGLYPATIIPCPATLKIYKSGKGFKAGDIFALKTQIGRGCIIKVVKVDGDGAIQKIQVIRFGLDYKTKFYSYLSSKNQNAYEYIHPLKIGAGQSDTKTYTVTTAGTNTFNVSYVIESGTPLVLVEVVRGGALVEPTPSYTATNGTTVTINDLQVGDQIVLTGILVKGTVPLPASPSYTERSGGFTDYGWATKQTYFQYDSTIPVSDPAWASDRLFADAAYVGETVQQFYADATDKVIDEDLAIIEIELGSVAKYPGYYSSSDGFVSDEIYIQDGNYYQSFSYVIRVEEELRRYADIVKALVHPAGMKVFSEYNIFSLLKLTAIQPKSLVNLQLPLADNPPSIANIDDRGFSYDSYDLELVNGIVQSTPSDGAGRVFAPQGKASKFSSKNITSAPVFVGQDTHYEEVSKNILEYVDQLSQQYKFVTKDVQDIISDYLEVRTFDYVKAHAEIINEPDSQEKFYETLKEDIQQLLEAQQNNVSKPVDDIISNIVDANSLAFFKNLVETINNNEVSNAEYEKPLIDSFNVDTEFYTNRPEKDLYEILSSPTDTYSPQFIKNLSEALVQIETLAKDYLKPLQDQFVTNELYQNVSDKYINDFTAPITDVLTIARIKEIADTLLASEIYSPEYRKNIADIIQLIDTHVGNEVEKYLNSNALLLEITSNQLSKPVPDDSITLSDIVAMTRIVFFNDIYDGLLDALVSQLTKNFYESVLTPDAIVIDRFKDLQESINISTNGRITLSPYDNEYYFAPLGDYQPATIIT